MSSIDTVAGGQEQHATIRVLLISAAAALGGFLFGYDTAVINGAVDAIRGSFGLSAAATGFAVSCALLGSALGAWYAGPLADRYGRVQTMRVAAALLRDQRGGRGLRLRRVGPDPVARRGRHRRGRRFGDRADLHRRSLAGARARPARFAAAAGDRAGHLRLAAQRRLAGERRGWRVAAAVVRAWRVALDVPRRRSCPRWSTGRWYSACPNRRATWWRRVAWPKRATCCGKCSA